MEEFADDSKSQEEDDEAEVVDEGKKAAAKSAKKMVPVKNQSYVLKALNTDEVFSPPAAMLKKVKESLAKNEFPILDMSKYSHGGLLIDFPEKNSMIEKLSALEPEDPAAKKAKPSTK